MDESQLVTSQLVMQLSMACPIFRSNVQSDTIHQNTIARFPRYLKKAPKIDDCSQRLRKDGEKGKKRKVEKRIFWETVVGSRVQDGVESKAGRTYFRGLCSSSVCPRGPWKLLLTRPSSRDSCERKNEIQRTSGVRRPESSETRNGFLRFRRWQDERRVICLLSVDDKARSPLPSSLLLGPELSSSVLPLIPSNRKGNPRPLSLGARVPLCKGYQRGSISTAKGSTIL